MILALDLGARTGYCLGETSIVKSGVLELADKKDPQPARRFIQLNSKLCDLAEGRVITRIFYEAPHMRGYAATFSLMGLAAAVEAWAFRRGLPRPTRVHSGTIKKHVTGNGRAEKIDVMQAVQARIGLQIHDDNEADAIALWLYAVDTQESE
jgi:Holliday junction resolvasome RuvABC endonuclease subunit